MKEYQLDFIKKDLTEHLISKTKEFKENEKVFIDIYSPLLEYLMKNRELVPKLSINIPLVKMIKKDVLNDYIDIFSSKKLNYESVNITLSNYYQFYSLNKLKFKNKKIRCLFIRMEDCDEYIDEDEAFPLYQIKILNNNAIQKNLLSLTLCNLSIEFENYSKIDLFKSLKYLDFNRVSFSSTYYINITNLESLYLCFCFDVFLYSDNGISQLLNIKIDVTNISNKIKIKFPYLRSIVCYDDLNIFNYDSLENLEYLESYCRLFSKLKKSPLKEIKIIENEKNENFDIFSHLSTIKSIKKAQISLTNINSNLTIEENKINNNALESLQFILFKEAKKCGGLTYWKYITSFSFGVIEREINDKNQSIYDGEYKIKIEENKNSKINILKIKLYDKISHPIIFNIHSFMTLAELSLVNVEINEDLFPLFQRNCNILFNSLNLLEINAENIELIIFENIINNINKCLLLNKLILESKIASLSKDKYLILIRKVTSLKNIFTLRINIRGSNATEYYSKSNLKKINPKICSTRKYNYNIEIF